MRVDVRFLDARLRDQLPGYATPGAAGLDLRACVDAPLLIEPGTSHLIRTGLAIHIADAGYAALDVFMCGKASPDACIPVLREAFQAKRVEVSELLRGQGT